MRERVGESVNGDTGGEKYELNESLSENAGVEGS